MKKILIINLGGIGDILLSIPALNALRSFYPRAEIHGLFTKKNYALVKGLKYFKKLFIFNMESEEIISLKNIFNNIRTLFILRGEHFDIAVNMRTIVSKKGAGKIKFILNIINPKIKAGRNTDGLGHYFDIKVPETLYGEKYEMEYDIDTVKALGVDVIDRNIDYDPDKESFKKVEKLLEEEKISETGIIIGIHPGGKPSHRWPKENFIKVMKDIYPETNCNFIITGSGDETGLADEIINKAGVKAVSVSGKLNIQELSALIKKCDLFISNDTGPMHLASILKTPLIALFGPGYIIRFDPRNISDKATVLYKEEECSPCDKTVCDSMKCLEKITPKEVTAEIRSLLGKR